MTQRIDPYCLGGEGLHLSRTDRCSCSGSGLGAVGKGLTVGGGEGVISLPRGGNEELGLGEVG